MVSFMNYCFSKPYNLSIQSVVFYFLAAVPRSEVPDQEKWRLAYLMKLIAATQQMESSCEDTCEINALIKSLCSS